MEAKEFRKHIIAIIPRATDTAFSKWEELVQDLSDFDAVSAEHVRDELCAAVLMISRRYGAELATTLFNHGEQSTMLASELPRAAELLANGMPMEKVDETITYCVSILSHADAEELHTIMDELRNTPTEPKIEMSQEMQV